MKTITDFRESIQVLHDRLFNALDDQKPLDAGDVGGKKFRGLRKVDKLDGSFKGCSLNLITDS
ncbi:hypothetical protein [Endozoicomonas sp.]|uniref:hypothetical protein n=1 Tax=Endozoicomonas sp. TaxID=1892382 RepID=UPI003AF556D3